MRTNKSDIANRKIARQIITTPPEDIRCGTGASWDKKLLITCPICFTKFHRPPSHVARVATCYCSRACSAEGHKIRVISECVSCGKPMELPPSSVGKKTTCSKKCSTLRRSKGGKSNNCRGFAAVISRIKKIQERGECVNCGVKHGPWAVRNLSGEMQSDGEVIINDENTELWCRHCHLKDVAPLGPLVRDAAK